jgi:hypothetical protein
MRARSHVYSSCLLRQACDSAVALAGKVRLGQARDGMHVEERAVGVEDKR